MHTSPLSRHTQEMSRNEKDYGSGEGNCCFFPQEGKEIEKCKERTNCANSPFPFAMSPP